MFSFQRNPFIRRYPRLVLFVLALLLVVVSSVFFLSAQDSKEAQQDATITPEVRVASVALLSDASGPIELVGEVRSVTQATLKAQKNGEVVRVNVVAGQAVSVGGVLVEIENAQERAALLQAEGVLAAAEAGLARVRAGARTEDRLSASASTQSADASLAQARTTARTNYASALATAQDAIFVATDPYFSNPQTVSPTFTIYSATYDERQPIEDGRVALGLMLEAWKKENNEPITDATLPTYLVNAEARLARTKAFLESVNYFVAKREARGDITTAIISADNATLAAARQAVDNALSSVTGAHAGLAAAESNFVAQSGTEQKIQTGERPEDLRQAEAVVTQAKGTLLSARAAFENSLVRTPINGIVTTLGLSRGDFVTALTDVATVVGVGGLQIETYISADLKDRVLPNTKVLVEGVHEGVVVSVEPGVDPATKRSKVIIGLPKVMGLENGAFVRVSVQPTTTLRATPAPETTTGLYIPITAIKVLPTGLVVFSVTDEGTLRAHSVSEGAIVGDRMRITEGLTSDLTIVTDARGLNEGEKVTVATN